MGLPSFLTFFQRSRPAPLPPVTMFVLLDPAGLADGVALRARPTFQAPEVGRLEAQPARIELRSGVSIALQVLGGRVVVPCQRLDRGFIFVSLVHGGGWLPAQLVARTIPLRDAWVRWNDEQVWKVRQVGTVEVVLEAGIVVDDQAQRGRRVRTARWRDLVDRAGHLVLRLVEASPSTLERVAAPAGR